MGFAPPRSTNPARREGRAPLSAGPSWVLAKPGGSSCTETPSRITSGQVDRVARACASPAKSRIGPMGAVARGSERAPLVLGARAAHARAAPVRVLNRRHESLVDDTRTRTSSNRFRQRNLSGSHRPRDGRSSARRQSSDRRRRCRPTPRSRRHRPGSSPAAPRWSALSAPRSPGSTTNGRSRGATWPPSRCCPQPWRGSPQTRRCCCRLPTEN